MQSKLKTLRELLSMLLTVESSIVFGLAGLAHADYPSLAFRSLYSQSIKVTYLELSTGTIRNRNPTVPRRRTTSWRSW